MSATAPAHDMQGEAVELLVALEAIGVALAIRPDGSISFRAPAPLAEATLADARRLRAPIAAVLRARLEATNAPPPPAPDPARWFDAHARARHGPSWADVANAPQPGDRCQCCRQAAWWTEANNPRGWRCLACHPPAALPDADVQIIRFGVGSGAMREAVPSAVQLNGA